MNGEPLEVAGPLTIGALLAELNVDARRVAVEHNLVILKRDRFESTAIADGDEIEIVNFVGGGCLSSTAVSSARRARRTLRRRRKE